MALSNFPVYDVMRFQIASPLLSKHHVCRLRLVPELTEILSKKLTLISAPAGYGKTMLAGELCHAAGIPAAWCTIHSENCSLDDLFKTLALSVNYALGEDYIDTAELHDDEAQWGYAGLFAKALQQVSGKILLVLDNCHLLDNNDEIIAFIDLLLNLLPKTCHIIFVSRTQTKLNLAKFVIQQDVTIFSKKHLVFNQEEAELLATNLGISHEICEVAFQRSEGWVAALLMLLQHPLQYSDFAQDLLHQYVYDEIVESLTIEETDALFMTLPLRVFDDNDVKRITTMDMSALKSLIVKHQILEQRMVRTGTVYSYSNFLAQSIITHLQQHPSDKWQASCQKVAAILKSYDDIRALQLYLDIGDIQAIRHLIEKSFQSWVEKDFLLINSQLVDTCYELEPDNIYLCLLKAESLIKTDPKQAEYLFRKVLHNSHSGDTLYHSAELGLIRAMYYGGNFDALVDTQAYDLINFEAMPSRYNRIIAKNFVARAYMSLENYTQAHTIFSEMYQEAKELNDEYLEILAIRGLAAYADYVGDCQQAVHFNLQAHLYWQKRENWLEIIRIKNNLASSYYSLGKFQQALELAQSAVNRMKDYGLANNFQLIFCTLGDICLSLSLLEQAQKAFERIQQCNHRFARFYALTGLARVALKKKQYPLAVALANQAKKVSSQHKIMFIKGLTLMIIACVHHAQGEDNEAFTVLSEARKVYNEAGLQREEARTLQLLLQIERAQGQELRQSYQTYVQALGYEPHCDDLISLETKKQAAKNSLQVMAFGQISFELDGKPISVKDLKGKKPTELLLYLCIHNVPKSKDQIIYDIWGEDTNGSRQFSVALSRVRNALNAKDSVQREGALYYLSPSFTLEEASKKILDIQIADFSEESLLYLAQFDLANYLPGLYSNWALEYRQKVETHILALVHHICQYNHQNHWDIIFTIVEAALTIDPDNEILHIWLIHYFEYKNLRSRTRLQIEKYQQAMLSLGVEADAAILKKIGNF